MENKVMVERQEPIKSVRESEIVGVLRRVYVPENGLGFKYMKEAVIMLLEKPDLIFSMTKELYPAIAKICGSSSRRVERAIRYSIEMATLRAPADELFDALYEEQRILFSVIVNMRSRKAWKSKKHSNGELCGGGDCFTVGIDTPTGTYGYQYDNKYWDMFDCQILETAPDSRNDGKTELGRWSANAIIGTGCSAVKKPTNSEFLASIANYIRYDV